MTEHDDDGAPGEESSFWVENFLLVLPVGMFVVLGLFGAVMAI
jgi:hypothetical protein